MKKYFANKYYNIIFSDCAILKMNDWTMSIRYACGKARPHARISPEPSELVGSKLD